VHNYIIENYRLSTGKNAAIISVVAPVQSGSQKWTEAQIQKTAVQFGNVLP